MLVTTVPTVYIRPEVTKKKRISKKLAFHLKSIFPSTKIREAIIITLSIVVIARDKYQFVIHNGLVKAVAKYDNITNITIAPIFTPELIFFSASTFEDGFTRKPRKLLYILRKY